MEKSLYFKVEYPMNEIQFFIADMLFSEIEIVCTTLKYTIVYCEIHTLIAESITLNMYIHHTQDIYTI